MGATEKKLYAAAFKQADYIRHQIMCGTPITDLSRDYQIPVTRIENIMLSTTARTKGRIGGDPDTEVRQKRVEELAKLVDTGRLWAKGDSNGTALLLV